MLELPRSARLSSWGTGVLSGTVGPTGAVRAVTGRDEPHQVVLGPDVRLPGFEPAADAGTAGLPDLLAALAGIGAVGLRVVLPTAGDVLGLPGPAEFNRAALQAGECVLVEPARLALGLVPGIRVFGSTLEPGTLVTWHVHRVGDHRVTDLGSVAEADQHLQVALREATDELARLDVAAWREDAAERLAAIRSGALPRTALPPTAPPRCVRVLATAARVRAIVDLATEDDGAAVSSGEATRRAETLRTLDQVSRRALVAAVNGLLEPGADQAEPTTAR